MGSKQVKELRGQVRIAVKELLPEVLSAEIAAAIKKDLSDELTVRLDNIESGCQTELAKADKRSRAVQGFIVQSAQQEINHQLFNMNVTLQAWEEVVGEKLGDKAELNKLIGERKKAIADRIKTENNTKLEEAVSSPKEESKEVANVEA